MNRIDFRNDEEKDFSITALEFKKIRWSKKFEKSTYNRLFNKNKVSVWLFIADVEKYETPSKFIQGLKNIKEIEIFSPETGKETIVSFRHRNIHSHDLTTILEFWRLFTLRILVI